MLGAGKGTYFLSSCALWLSDITMCAALGHDSTKLLEREGEIIIQREPGVFSGLFLRSGSRETIESSILDEIKRDLRRSRGYFSAASGIVCIDIGSCIIPRRVVFVDSIGTGDYIMHYFAFTLSLLCNANIYK